MARSRIGYHRWRDPHPGWKLVIQLTMFSLSSCLSNSILKPQPWPNTPLGRLNAVSICWNPLALPVDEAIRNFRDSCVIDMISYGLSRKRSPSEGNILIDTLSVCPLSIMTTGASQSRYVGMENLAKPSRHVKTSHQKPDLSTIKTASTYSQVVNRRCPLAIN